MRSINPILNFKLQALAALALLFYYSALYANITENNTSKSFCHNCFYNISVSPGVDVIFSGNKKTIDQDDFYLLDQLQKTVNEVKKSPYLEYRLPESWSIIIDNELTETSGYFDPNLTGPNGELVFRINEKEIYSQRGLKSLVVHELWHLVHHVFRPHEHTWVEEGLAQLGQFLVTHHLSPAFFTGFEYPETSLTAKIDHSKKTNPDEEHRIHAQYGHSFQYFYYIYQNCGEHALFDQLLTSESKKVGVPFLNEVLKANASKFSQPLCSNFKSSFIAFQKARFFPKPLKKSEHIRLTVARSARKNKIPMVTIPEYSAQAYPIPVNQACRKNYNSFQINGYCLEIHWPQ